MPQKQYPIIFIQDAPTNLTYKSPQSGGGEFRLPYRDRSVHGRTILQSLENTWRQFQTIQADFIEGTAAEIATCNFIGVFPVIGWWRQRGHLGKWDKQTRYALIVSLETPVEEVDLYTPVAVTLKIPIETRL